MSKYQTAVNQFRVYLISETLQTNHGNICAAARELGVHRNTLNRTINELHIDVEAIKNGKTNGHAKATDIGNNQSQSR